jgi:hypothetical protein
MKHKRDEKDMCNKELSRMGSNVEVSCHNNFRTSSHESIGDSDNANKEMGEDDECPLH